MAVSKKRKKKKDVKKKKNSKQNMGLQYSDRRINLYISLKKKIIKNIPQALKDEELTNLTLSQIYPLLSKQSDYTEKEIIDAVESVFYTCKKEDDFEMVLWEIESNYEDLCKTGIYHTSNLPLVYFSKLSEELKENNKYSKDECHKLLRTVELMRFGVELSNNYLIKQNYPEFYSIIKITSSFTNEELESMVSNIKSFKDLEDFIKIFPKESEYYTTKNRVLNERILKALEKNENIVIEHEFTGEGTSYDNDFDSIYDDKEVYVILSYYNIYYKDAENSLSESLDVSIFSKVYYS